MTIALGFEKIFSSPVVIPVIDASGNNQYLGQRFTAPGNLVISGAAFITGSINWAGSGVVGVQSNNAGNPNNTYLVSGIWTHGSGNTAVSTQVPFSSMFTTTSGTIYHIVWQPTLAGTNIGAGSKISLRSQANAFNNSFHERAVGSLFNCISDLNLSARDTVDSGATWNPIGSDFRGINFIINCSGGGAGTLQNFGNVTDRLGQNKFAGGIGMAGIFYMLDKTYYISGVSVWAAAAGANAGSLWCRLEYSGLTVGGVRTEIGSTIVVQTPATGTLSSPEFFATMNAGSDIYVWFYAPSGLNNQGGSRYQFRSLAEVLSAAGSYSFGLGSSMAIESTDAGSTITFRTDEDMTHFFAESGAAGVVGVTDFYTYSDGFNTTIS